MQRREDPLHGLVGAIAPLPVIDERGGELEHPLGGVALGRESQRGTEVLELVVQTREVLARVRAVERRIGSRGGERRCR